MLLRSTCVSLETLEVFPYGSSDVTVMFPEHCPAITVNAFDVITSCVGVAALLVREKVAAPVTLGVAAETV